MFWFFFLSLNMFPPDDIMPSSYGYHGTQFLWALSRYFPTKTLGSSTRKEHPGHIWGPGIGHTHQKPGSELYRR